MKTLVISLLLAGACFPALGQGQVQFRTYYTSTSPPIDAPVYWDYLGGQRVNGSNTAWRAALLGGPVTATVAAVPFSYAGAGGI